ncbi:TPA: hypothetical protein EYG59_16955 [Candidatus Poribacteria bacterium]|nr:hypothetical protein [Candidatus Poribacteria bacterium]
MELLAINGGPQAVTLDQQQANMWPVIDEEVTEAVVAQLKTGKLSFSETILEFEREFADYHGSKYALAHNNGTASIHAALFALGIGPGCYTCHYLLGHLYANPIVPSGASFLRY